MLQETFKAILITSLAGTALTGVLILFRPVTKKVFGYMWHYYIWLAVLCVMLLPVRFGVPQISRAAERPQQMQVQTMQRNEPAHTGFTPSQTNTQAAAELTMTQRIADYAGKTIHNGTNILAAVWLAGMFLMLCISMAGYARLTVKIHKKSDIISCPELERYTNKKIVVRECETLSSPFIMGIIRPTLILPSIGLTPEQLDNILRHEMTHFKRRDVLYKWFAHFVKCVHWFNPAVYYVVRQINIECEISCDLSVVSQMNQDEEKSYIDTILSLLSSKSKNIPLTTGMTGSKKILKRRFTMIKNKKATSKIMSVLSALIAAVLLSTTVFASGVLSDLTTDHYTIDIRNHRGEKIELNNKPFIENSEVYVPLRELFEKMGYLNSEDSSIKWDNGTIEISVVFENRPAYYGLDIGKNWLRLAPPDDNYSVGVAIEMSDVPILKGGTTYVVLNDMNYMMYSYFGIRDENNQLCKLTYNVYEKNGTDVTAQIAAATEAKKENVLMKQPESTAALFLDAFASGNFEKMKTYCTQSCIDTFFGDGYVFGMKRAELVNVDINETEYAKSSNDFNILVTVNMTPHENSVFDPSQTSTSFYICLFRQPDGRYLINEFATGV